MIKLGKLPGKSPNPQDFGNQLLASAISDIVRSVHSTCSQVCVPPLNLSVLFVAPIVLFEV
jgi:hypothetical protein